MNISLLELAGKLISLVAVSCMSLFNIGNYKEVEINNINQNVIKDTSIVNVIKDYKTIYQYNSKLPSNKSKVLVEGVKEVAYVTPDNKTIQVIQEKKDKVVEIGTGRIGTYTGRVSGYGPDCPGCSKFGNVACKTREKKAHSLVNDGIYYNDEEFGKVRIIAAALKGFPCGTIVEITKKDKTPYLAVVLDTGATMVNSWAKGEVWFDLAYTTQKDKTVLGADGLTGNNLIFNVQRWGW